MKTKPVFKGAATALITPTTEKGVDLPRLGKLIDWQIERGINALVLVGTSGEAPTLNDREHLEALEYAIERINGRVPAIAGTGSNDTAHAVMMTKEAASMGYNAVLTVTPYYNKSTQRGLISMFTHLAESSEIPLILYNVPSRTGINIEPATYAVLAQHPNIAGIKEANGNMSKLVETASMIGDEAAIYSGNDDQIVPILSMGGQGVISVLSNVMPAETVEMCSRFFAGDVAGAAKMQMDLLPLINALFCEVNPIPVKAAMAAMGFCENHVRLPLVTMEPEHEAKLLSIMRGHGLIE